MMMGHARHTAPQSLVSSVTLTFGSGTCDGNSLADASLTLSAPVTAPLFRARISEVSFCTLFAVVANETAASTLLASSASK
eukprot:CAMPEP_0195146534 /NCGR_PEP_ID=MMETSP0448-20130528/171807_1 /TAXON_ID=66468 /ORGANISM="Heterocapsa triquestra, Strain CCMP 448" /LENGTH=80 /DNA_ID=CAMNT_0040185085 /DNA_START=212 /DNA_END=454 /DNA_ORIENTATION=+